MDIPPLFLDDVKDCPGDYIDCEICRFQDQCFEMKMGFAKSEAGNSII